MYFILNRNKTKILHFYETFEQLNCEYKLHNFDKDIEGYIGYLVGDSDLVEECTIHYCINYTSFQTEEYKKKFPIPPKGIELCVKYLNIKKRKRIIEKLLYV